MTSDDWVPFIAIIVITGLMYSMFLAMFYHKYLTYRGNLPYFHLYSEAYQVATCSQMRGYNMNVFNPLTVPLPKECNIGNT